MKAVASSATISLGEAGHILVTFERPMVGMKDLLVRIHSNDVREPVQTLTLGFEVVP